jgi:hypothetical protein
VATGVEMCLLLRVPLSPSCATQATVTSPTSKVMSNTANVGHSLSDRHMQEAHVREAHACVPLMPLSRSKPFSDGVVMRLISAGRRRYLSASGYGLRTS